MAFNLFPSISQIIQGTVILFGIYCMSKLIWMAVYEFKYGHGAGKLYLKFGKRLFKKE